MWRKVLGKERCGEKDPVAAKVIHGVLWCHVVPGWWTAVVWLQICNSASGDTIRSESHSLWIVNFILKEQPNRMVVQITSVLTNPLNYPSHHWPIIVAWKRGAKGSEKLSDLLQVFFLCSKQNQEIMKSITLKLPNTVNETLPKLLFLSG